MSLYKSLVEATSGVELESIIFNGVRIQTGDVVLVMARDLSGTTSSKYAYVRTLKYQNSIPVFKPVWLYLRSESAWKQSDFCAEDFLVAAGDDGGAFLPVTMISCMLGFTYATISPAIKTQVQPKLTADLFQEQVNRVYALSPPPFVESKADRMAADAPETDDLQALLLKEAVLTALSGFNNNPTNGINNDILEQVPVQNPQMDCAAPASTPVVPS